MPQLIVRRVGRVDAPLSFAQERMFLLDRVMPGLAAYNVPTLVRVRATLDADRLQAAFDRIVARHEILRTRIEVRDGVPVQHVMEHRPFELGVFDVRSLPDDERPREVRRALADCAQAPFDLGGDVLLRARLVHEDEHDLLLVVLHHTGSDHVSSQLMFAELAETYSALGQGTEPSLPDLPIQYADFSAWQRDTDDADRTQELVAYWREKLTGAPERLELPGDHPRPSVQSYRGALVEFTIDAQLGGELRSLARARGVTTFVLLLAAFKTLLHRYTSAEDIVVGAPVSGRHHEETAALLGFFSNTLVLRTDLSGDPPFAELLERVRETTLGAQVHQELPFEQLVAALNPKRTQSHTPLFQVLFGHDVAGAEAPSLGGEQIEPLPVPGWEWSRFDLSIVVRDQPDGSLRAQLEYASDLFERPTIDRLIEHYRTLLASVTADPDQRLSELSLLTVQERRTMLVEWNATARDYDRRALHELFRAQALRTPDATAVVCEQQRITFAELDARANQLAAHLIGQGTKPGSLVGVALERSIDLVVSLLAVLKAGAAYVPIDPSYPPQRQEFMLQDAGAPVLLTSVQLLGVVDSRGASVVCVDRNSAAIGAQSTSDVGVLVDPNDRAYVIYTSGSTGLPKGVEISHRSVANLVAQMARAPGIGATDVLANLTTPAFDLSVPDWYLPLLTGARLAIIPREATLDGVELADWLTRSGATFVQATPTTWKLLVDSGWEGRDALKIVCGGEALPSALAEQLLPKGAELWHMYGPTETTVWSSIRRLYPGDPVTLGGPIANTSFYVLDNAGAPLPIGIPGELHIGGDGLALGYHDRGEMTAEMFVPDRFSGVPGTRLYRTGDLVRWCADATLEFLGRIDQQVKVRGFRIELGEIESVIDTRDDVSASVAIVREDVPGDQRIVAYVAGDGADGPHHDSIRQLLKAKLPPYMVPSAIVTLERLPVTANGKLDRLALPAPDGARPDLDRAYVAPDSPIEEALAEVWSEVLGIDRVGTNDDFFDLGGHSMLAVRMLSSVHDVLGVELSLVTIFDRPTIRELADAVTVELVGEYDHEDLASLLSEAESGK